MHHYKYRFLPKEPVVLVELVGLFELEPSLRTLRHISEHERASDTRGLIWDCRRRTSAPTPNDVRRLTSEFERWPRVAIVTPGDLQYGMARIAQGISGDRARAFRTSREALEWIRSRPVGAEA